MASGGIMSEEGDETEGVGSVIWEEEGGSG